MNNNTTIDNKNEAANLVKVILEKIGPGILFAAACIGTSHLVQSTRAGAEYGLAMWGVIILACLVRYPAFRFGADYAAATGKPLTDSYFKQGRWAVAVFTLELFVNMFIATSAVALITGGIAKHLLPIDIDVSSVASLILLAGATILISGKYHLLEGITKLLVALFSVVILLATVLTVPDLQTTEIELLPIVDVDIRTILFIIALAGWMPTGMGASTLQSLWVCAKSKDLGRQLTIREARFDFNVGYIATVFLALCFLLLGTVLMKQEGIAVATSSVTFSGQVISLFTASIGQWVYPVIAVAVLSIMLSTVFTLMDGCPRALGMVVTHKKTKEGGNKVDSQQYYSLLVIFQSLACIVVLQFFTGSFKEFIDLATSVSFLVAPLFAFINHRAVFSSEVPVDSQPGQWVRTWSLLGIFIMGGFALFYVGVNVLY